MRGVSWGCVGMYMFRMRMGVMGLLLIVMAWRYGDICLGDGIFVVFSFECMDLGIIVRTPPLMGEGPAYRLFLCAMVLELLYIIL